MISLIHPSRGRFEKSGKTTWDWLRKSMFGHDIEFIISVDEDDDELSFYLRGYNQNYITVNKNRSVVDATNHAAKKAIGNILIYLSDDFDCPSHWDASIKKYFEGVTEPMLLKVDDCLQPFDTRVLTIPIMNRALYQRLGYFWNPLYRSMFVDQDLYEVCAKNGWLKFAPELKFPHNHVSIGKAQDDETYRRSAANWDQGKSVFRERQRLGFPI